MKWLQTGEKGTDSAILVCDQVAKEEEMVHGPAGAPTCSPKLVVAWSPGEWRDSPLPRPHVRRCPEAWATLPWALRSVA